MVWAPVSECTYEVCKYLYHVRCGVCMFCICMYYGYVYSMCVPAVYVHVHVVYSTIACVSAYTCAAVFECSSGASKGSGRIHNGL